MSHGGGGSERWLISYADFITLLMVLFVVLYSMSQVDVDRYKMLAESLHAAFGGGGPVSVVDPDISEGGASGGDSAPAPVTVSGIPERIPDSLDVASRMGDLLTASNMASEVSIRNNIEGVLISLSEKLLFEPGTAVLKPEGPPVLDKVAQMVLPLDNDIRVVGHTDSTPPVDPRYPTNWELSAARAVTVVNYMVAAGVAPERFTASGRADYEPIFPNDTPEHRAFNSRADIIIVYPIDSQVFDVDFFETDGPVGNSIPSIEESTPGE